MLCGLLAGCGSAEKKQTQEQQADWQPDMQIEATEETTEPQVSTIDLSLDTFLAELRSAAIRRNMHKLASMMTSNFGYQLNPPLEGEGVFQYWDNNDLWNELILILSEEFVPNGNFMVSPPEFADSSMPYNDYRAGLIKVGDEWKFAYFVRD